MDPNANLAEQDRCIADLSGYLSSLGAFARHYQIAPSTWDTTGRGSLRADWRADVHQTRARLAELRTELRQWIARGGFAPDWSKHPIAAKRFGIRNAA